jgi:hypothetical protein
MKCFAFYFYSSYIDESIDDDELDDQKPNRSIGRDYAPVFFILGIVFAFILLALVNILYKQYQIRKRQTNDSIYSPVSTANEFNLN